VFFLNMFLPFKTNQQTKFPNFVTLNLIKQRYWLFLGAGSYLLLSVMLLNPIAADHHFFIDFLIILMLGLHLFYFYQLSKLRKTYDIESIFEKLVLGGLLTLGISFLPDLLDFLDQPIFFIKVVKLIGIYAFLYYALYTLLQYKRLSEINENISIRYYWRILFVILSLSCFIYFIHHQLPISFYIVIYGITFIFFLGLAFRVKWIAFIPYRLKWLSILFLSVLVLILLGIAQNLFFYDLPLFIHQPYYLNVFFILLLGFLSLYTTMSLISLIFNLPIASVTEQRNQEMQSLRVINEFINDQDDNETAFQFLFKKCLIDTASQSGWLIIGSFDENNKDQAFLERIYHDEHIDKEEIADYLVGIGFHDLIKENDSEYYFPQLKELEFFDKNTNFQSLLLLPVFFNGKLQASIFLVKSIQYGFDNYQIQLAQSYINQAQLTFENDALLKANVESDRVKQELSIARRIQKGLIPTDFPVNETFEMAGFSESAFEVGGDYLDFLELDSNRLAVIVADVSGSGTSAAFYMAHLKGIFQSLVQINLPVDMFLEFANEAISKCLERTAFVTVTYCIFDFENQVLTYSRAGHTPLLYYSVELDMSYYLEDEGMGLGIVRNSSYSKYIKAYQQSFVPGDVFVFFTDGIIEARSPKTGKAYGTERLLNSLQSHADTDAETIKKIILKKYRRFTAANAGKDDRSLIVVKIK